MKCFFSLNGGCSFFFSPKITILPPDYGAGLKFFFCAAFSSEVFFFTPQVSEVFFFFFKPQQRMKFFFFQKNSMPPVRYQMVHPLTPRGCLVMHALVHLKVPLLYHYYNQ